MKNLKESIHKEFQAIRFDEWKAEAQKTLRNVDLDTAITKQLTEKISVKSIYEQDHVQQYFDLYFPTKSDDIQKYSLLTGIAMECESDLEIAKLLHTVKYEKKNNAVEVMIDPNFFLSIAKFRAVRYMLAEMGREDVIIIAKSYIRNKSYSDNENNLIRLTTEAMSAIIGGADKVDLKPYNSLRQNDEFGKRVTDNILLLLNEESYLSQVKDPLSGSYLIENLTSEFIASVEKYSEEFSKLKSKDKVEEYVLMECAMNDYRNLISLETQKKKIIGVNIYQNKKDNIAKSDVNAISNLLEFEVHKSTIDNLNPKIYVANLEETNPLQSPIVMALNTYNIPFQISGVFELVEDAFNAIKLYDPDLVIVNGSKDVMRILGNMLDEYNVAGITEFHDSSIIENIETIIDYIGTEE